MPLAFVLRVFHKLNVNKWNSSVKAKMQHIQSKSGDKGCYRVAVDDITMCKASSKESI